MCATPARHRATRKDSARPEQDFWAARHLLGGAGGASTKHARKIAPKYGLPIGRVGALAVSLGVGFAIAHSSGVAYADTEPSAASSGPKSDNGTGAGPGGGDTSTRTSSDSTDGRDAQPSSKGDQSDIDHTGTPGHDDTGDADEAHDSVTGSAGGSNEPSDDPASESDTESSESSDDSVTDSPATESPVAETSSTPSGHGQHPDVSPSMPTTPSAAPDRATSVDDTATSRAESGAASEGVPAPTDDDRADPDLTASVRGTQDDPGQAEAHSVRTPPPARATAVAMASAAPAGENTQTVNVMTALVSGVVSPFVDPHAPATAPWFDALLGWVRRQIVHTFFNESPVYGPIDSQQIVTGQVLVDLHAYDPNGDPLKYTIVQPAHGLVFRDPVTGQFVYTPTSVVTGSPLQDSFKVVISDGTEHLRGPIGRLEAIFHAFARLIGVAEPDDVTVTVPITVTPIVQLPPVVVTTGAATYIVGSNPVKVVSTAVITDADSPKLSSATVTLTNGQSGDVLGYTAPLGNPVTAQWDAATKTLKLSGSATLAQYEAALKAVSFSTTQGGAPRIASISVKDESGLQSLVSGIASIVVLAIPPLLVVAPLAIGTAGSAVRVSPIVSITDLDSQKMSSATVAVKDATVGDVLGYGSLPSGITATVGSGSVTFTGVASVVAYQQVLQSVTLTSPDVGIKTVTFTLTDDQGEKSVPVSTAVTFVGLPVAAPPLIVTAPVAVGTTGSPVTVSPAVVITDIDSTQLSSATVSASGGSLSYGTLPSGVTATPGSGTVTFTGAASVAAYQQLLQSVTLTSPGAGIETVTFTVTDNQGLSSLPTATAVTVLGLPVAVPPLVVVAPVAAGTSGSPVTVSPVVVITDVDSTQLASATVTTSGGSLSYGTLPPGVTATPSGSSVTFTGAASVAAYQQLLQSITLTSADAVIATVSFTVTDDQGQVSVPATTVVTVLGVPVAAAPLVVTVPVAGGTAGSAVTVSPVVVITDVDSTQLASATVTTSGGSLSYGTLPTGMTATPSGNSVTFTGAASVAAYQQLLQSITLTSADAVIATVTFTVIDDQGQASPQATTIVTVVGLPVAAAPLVVVAPIAAGSTSSPVTVSPVVVITDVDSTQLASATVTTSGGSLSYGTLPTGVTETPSGNSVTFTGAASIAAYQQLLQSVTVTSSSAGIATVSFSVIDDQGQASVPATTIVTVVGLPVAAAPLVVVAPIAAGSTSSPVTVSPIVVITDVDSTQLASATVTTSGGSLSYGTLPTGMTATPSGNSVTFTGAASVAAYQELLQSITLTSADAVIATVSFTVTDDQGQASAPGTTIVTVLGVPVAAAPLVVTAPVAAGATGSAVTVSPGVVITDVDSTQLASATVTTSEGSLSYGTLPPGVTATPSGNSVTFTGAASIAAYQQLLQSVTLTSATSTVVTVSFTVTDDQGQVSVPATTIVTVVGLPVAAAPLVVTAPVAASTAGTAVTVSPAVVITDVDSTQLASATVTASAGSLSYGTLPPGVTATPSGNSVTFTGAASVAAYQQLLQSVTVTSADAVIATVSFTVTDDQGQASAPGTTIVTVLGVPVAAAPLVVTAPVAAGTAGTATTVSPIVVITDIDSTHMSSATVTTDTPGLTLGYGSLPQGITATSAPGSVTFSGTASVDAYQQLLQSVTVTSAASGIASVSFGVTDAQGVSSLLATTIVTMLGVALAAAPLVVTAPTAAGTKGSAIAVSPAVMITDIDSTELASATVSVSAGSGASLDYGTLPGGVTATLSANSVTFTGVASVTAYEQLLQSVTLTSPSVGIVAVSFTVTDDEGRSSVPAATVVTVLGVPVAAAPLVVVAPVSAGTAGGAVAVSPVVVITDVDSAQVASATVTVDGAGVLDYGALPSGVTATAGANSVTFTGAASVAAYQQLLQSVTLTSSSAGIATVTFTVTDDQGQTSVPATTIVTVVALPVAAAPLVVVAPVSAGTAGGAVTVSPVVVIADVDSTQLASATVTVDGAGTLGYGSLPSGVTATAGANSVTFTGAASVAAYEQFLQSVTLTLSSAGIATVKFTVTDDQGQTSVLATTIVTVVALPVAAPPLVVTAPVASGTAGSAVTVSPVVVITDVDSTQLASATVTVDGAGVLDYGALPSGVTATAGANSVTFTGAASVAAYEQLLQSVTLTSSSAEIATVTFTLTDDQGESSVPATTVVTVLGVPVAVPPLVVTTPTAAGSTGGAITVSPVVVITDVDSAQLASATVTVDGAGTLGYGILPSGVTATSGTNSVTFTGAASVAAYQQLLQSVTLTSSSAGIATVTFTVTDDQGQASMPGATAVTILGVPVAIASLVVTTPTGAGSTGGAITVSPVVVITDVDSAQLASATATVDGTGVLGYGALPSGITATPGANSVTFTGAASVAAYQQLLQSITLTSSSAGIATVTFTVIDDQGQASVPAATVVTVLGVPVAVPPLVVTTPTAAGTTGSAVAVSPVVVITDVDSTQLASATVSVDGAGVLGYGILPSGVTATAGAGSVTFTGAASVAAYQQLLQSITLTSSIAGIMAVTFTVTDDQAQSSVPATTVVTVLGVPVAVPPLVVTTPTAAGTTASAVAVSPVVVITDVDSTQLASATVSVDGAGVLDYGTLPSGVTATPGAGSVTFTGAASVAAYQQLLQSITLTSSNMGILTVTFTVTDHQGQASVPATTTVTVLGVPVAIAPLVVTTPTAAGTTGSAVTVSPVVVITDVDSTQVASATVTVDGTGVLGYGALPSGVAATAGANSVTFTGAASVAAYQQLLQSITLTSSTTGITTVTFTVTDDQGQASVPAATVVTVLGVPVVVPPLVVTTPTAAGTTGSAVTVSPVVVITDVDSTQLASATVTVDGAGVLDYGTLPSGVTATPGANSVTFTGAASVAAYQQLLQSITLTSSNMGILTVTFTVTDDQGESSVPATTVVTVLGVPVAIAPLVVTTPTAAGTTGSAVAVSPVVVITDVDSTQLASATVSVDGAGVLGYGTLSSGVAATAGAGSVTFTGVASVAAYQQLLQSITLTSPSAEIATVSFTVIDDQGEASVPATTIVTVVALPVAVPPLVVTTPTAAGSTGGAITVSPVVVIVDSAQLASATVSVDGAGVLDYGALPSGVTATPGANSVTFTGAASVAAYQQLLQSITLTSSSAEIATVMFTVIDDQGQASVPAATVVTVLGVPVAVPPLVVTTPTAAGTTGSAVAVSPVVAITDVDSTQLASATVTVDGAGTLGYGILPSGVTATPGANSVTFTGAASVAAYQQLLQSITLTSSNMGILTVTFTVTDHQGQASVPATTVVTVLGVPVAVPPLVVTTPTAAGSTGGAITVSPVVVITDVDSAQVASATVTVDGAGTLTYGTLPSGVTATPGANSVTFTGAASVTAYQQLLQSITLTSNTTGITTVTFTVTDDQGQASVPATTAVTIVAVPIAAAPVLVTSVVNVSYTAGNSAVSVDPGVIVLDADSTTMSGAVVSIVGGAAAGETLSFSAPAGITGVYSGGVLTLSGTASLGSYQQALRSVTYATTSVALATIKTISFVITDSTGTASAPAPVSVTVLAAPTNVAPLVVTSATSVSYTAGNIAVTVDSGITVLDLDSANLSGATVKITGNFASGDTLSFTPQAGITGSYNSSTGTLTLSGTAALATYQQVLRSVTLSTSSSALAAIKTVSFTVSDSQGSASLPGTVTVTVLAAPINLAPLVATLIGPVYTAGNTAVSVNPLVTVTDLDSTNMTSATVAITGNFTAGDTLAFTTAGGITGAYNSSTGILTLSGTATTAQYQQVLQSVTFATSGTASAAIKTITYTVTDAQGATSPSATTTVTVLANNAPVLAAPLGGAVVLNQQLVSPTAAILDDSSYLQRAVITITNFQSVDNLTYTSSGGITGTYNTSTGVLTLTGLASVSDYQSVLQSLKFSKTGLNLLSFRNITMTVRDQQGLDSNTTSGTMTVLL